MQPQNELTRNAINRARQLELTNFQRALDTQWLNNRAEDGRMGRCLALIEKEAQMEKEFQERTDHAAIVNATAEKEARLAREVAKVRHDEAVELLRRHYLRERDPSLRTLMRKLQAGYVCRDLRQQILHNEYSRLQEKAAEDHANQTLLAALGDDQKEKEKELQKIQKAAEYCRELQQQMVSRQQQKQCMFEDSLIEQKMLDDVMRTIADEDQRELKQKHELMEKTRSEMVAFKRARDAWRAKQRALAIQEEAEVEKQQQAAADRSASIIAERQRRERIKEEINQRIGAKIMADEEEQQDRNNLIKMLQEHELLEKNVQDDIALRSKAEFVKMSTKTDLTAQMKLREREREQERQREADFRKETEAKLAAEHAKEDEKERKKKEKARQYALELKQQIEENARRRETERRLDDARAKAVFDFDKDWRAEVTKERSKIVEEHVPNILGYIQAGVISRGDLPAVRTGAARLPRRAALDLEALAAAGAAAAADRHPKCNAQCTVLRDY